MDARICLVLLSFFLSSAGSAQDHPHEACSLQGEDADEPKLSMVNTHSTTGWQCYANGNWSSFPLHFGDSIQVSHAANGWTCGYVTSDDGAGPEWIRDSDLTPVHADPNPPLSAWFGTWQGGEDRVQIQSSQKSGWLALNGTAVWDGFNGNQHIGEIEGEGKPSGNRLHYTEGAGEYACVVDMQLIGDHILAQDNQNCGGLNARFQGVWRRKKKP